MTTRQSAPRQSAPRQSAPLSFVAVWSAALLLAAAFALTLAWLGERATAAAQQPAQRPAIVAIGSSLTAHAIPVSTYLASPDSSPESSPGRAQSLLLDGRPHLRLASASITETQLIDALDSVLDQRPALVLLEANPLIVDFADRANQRSCDGWPFRIRNALSGAQLKIIEGYRAVRHFHPASIYTADPPNMGGAYASNAAVTERIYPFVVRAPCEEARLAADVARARAQKTRIVLVLMPRSADAERLLGPARVQALEARAAAMARRLGVPLFIPPGSWPNSRFLETAHMNLRGRADFLAALRRWWATAA